MSESEIVAHEDALRRAMLAGDVVALDRLIDDDLAFTTLTGDVVGKAVDLEAHASRTLQLTRLIPEDTRIRLYGDVAVAIVRVSAAGTFHGVPFDNTLRYLRVWHRRGDGWRIVAGGMSAVQET